VNNQYTAITGTKAEPSLAHDADGNITSDGTWSSYTYDHEDRLVSMSNGSYSVSFVYDYLGRRIRKSVSGSTSSDIKFLWANWTLVADLNASDGATALRGYVWGPDFTDARGQAGGAGALLAQTTSSGIFYAMPDQHGNIAGYLDSSGNLVAAREFSVFGSTVKSYGSASDYPIAYSSKYTDSETALVYYGFRYYNPRHGRFINRDPIEEAGGNNLYAICQNRGVSGWDVLGLDASDEAPSPPPPPPPPPPPTIPENTVLVDQHGRMWGYTGTTWVPLFSQATSTTPVAGFDYSGYGNPGNSSNFNGNVGYDGGRSGGGSTGNGPADVVGGFLTGSSTEALDQASGINAVLGYANGSPFGLVNGKILDFAKAKNKLLNDKLNKKIGADPDSKGFKVSSGVGVGVVLVAGMLLTEGESAAETDVTYLYQKLGAEGEHLKFGIPPTLSGVILQKNWQAAGSTSLLKVNGRRCSNSKEIFTRRFQLDRKRGRNFILKSKLIKVSGLLPIRSDMKYLLILQWPAASIKDFDNLIEIEDLLIEKLGKGSHVDGHDAGSGEMNIFVNTGNPEATFREVQAALGSHDFWVDARVAFREATKSRYTILWPKDLTEFKVT